MSSPGTTAAGPAEELDRYWNCRLTTTGRKSGLPRTVTVWFVLAGDRLYLTGGAGNPQWCRNLRVDGAAAIEIGGVTLQGHARVVDDPSAAARIRDRFTRKYVLARLSRLVGGYTRSVAVEVDLAPSPPRRS